MSEEISCVNIAPGTVPPSSGGSCPSDIPEANRIDCWPGGGASQSGCEVTSFTLHKSIYTLWICVRLHVGVVPCVDMSLLRFWCRPKHLFGTIIRITSVITFRFAKKPTNNFNMKMKFFLFKIQNWTWLYWKKYTSTCLYQGVMRFVYK